MAICRVEWQENKGQIGFFIQQSKTDTCFRFDTKVTNELSSHTITVLKEELSDCFAGKQADKVEAPFLDGV